MLLPDKILRSLFERLALLISGFLVPVFCCATHIVGGEINYSYRGNNSYEITLTVYRDCFNGVAPFDNPASIAIYNGSGVLVSNNSVYIADQLSLPAVVNNPCLIPPINLCYELAHYVFTANLPPVTGGYTIVYQRCCRNQTIVNISNVSNTGGTYMATIPGPVLATGNSNPVFNSLPPTFICQNEAFSFDHSATDDDGDSLVYELCTPLTGGSRNDPAPSPADPPPYTPVVFAFPYSVNNMMGGVPFTIDAMTGWVTASPLTAGQFVYGVCVKEFRNGILIGKSSRDFQLNVVPCPAVTVASIFSPQIVCGSLNATFQNSSYGASTYSWDFGDAATTSDTSSQFEPTYSYPDTGIYRVRLIAYSNFNLACNDTVVGEARIYPPFLTNFTLTNPRCTPDFQFQDASFGVNGNADAWSWRFGDGSSSTIPNPSHSYSSPGDYAVTLIAAADSGCEDTATVVAHVLRIPTADFNLELDTCRLTAEVQNLSQDASAYTWLVNGNNTALVNQTELQFPGSGNYTVDLTAVSDSGCSASATRSVQLPDLPVAGFQWSVAPCDSTVMFTNTSGYATNYLWDFGDSISLAAPSPSHTYTLAGSLPVTLYAISQYECTDTLKQDIFFVSYKAAGFSIVQDSCSGLVSFAEVTSNAVSYHWDFGDGTTSAARYPVHRFPKDGHYAVSLRVNGEYSCVDSATVEFDYETPKGERVYIPASFTPNGDGLNDVFSMSIYKPCDTYSLSIYNRWGQEIYSNDDAAAAAWDGTYNGSRVPDGLYVYLLRGRMNNRQGTIAVFR